MRSLGLVMRHALDDRRAEIIVPARVPVEHDAQCAQHLVGHAAAARRLNVVEQPDDLAALDGGDRPLPELGIDQPFERGAALVDGAQPLVGRLGFLARKVGLGDGAQRVLPRSRPASFFSRAGSRPRSTWCKAAAAAARRARQATGPARSACAACAGEAVAHAPRLAGRSAARRGRGPGSRCRAPRCASRAA